MLSELGRIGPFVIRTYTVLLDLAILAGLGIMAWQGKRIEDRPARWIDSGLAALVGGIVFGRLGHVLIYLAYFADHTQEMVQVWRGGLDWHGAVLGGLLGLALATRLFDLRFRQVSDVAAFILPLGAALIYTGCLMVSCGHGREVSSLSDYPPFLVAELSDLYGVNAPRLMSPLYGAVFSLVLLIAAFLFARQIRREGVRFWLVLALLGLVAFGIGFTRGDAIPMVGPLRLDQLLDLGIVLVGIAGSLIATQERRQPDKPRRERKAKKKPPPPRALPRDYRRTNRS
jgi:phosphatidylglycerol:prolipoprotein diacylglycerol transferase